MAFTRPGVRSPSTPPFSAGLPVPGRGPATRTPPSGGGACDGARSAARFETGKPAGSKLPGDRGPPIQDQACVPGLSEYPPQGGPGSPEAPEDKPRKGSKGAVFPPRRRASGPFRHSRRSGYGITPEGRAHVTSTCDRRDDRGEGPKGRRRHRKTGAHRKGLAARLLHASRSTAHAPGTGTLFEGSRPRASSIVTGTGPNGTEHGKRRQPGSRTGGMRACRIPWPKRPWNDGISTFEGKLLAQW